MTSSGGSAALRADKPSDQVVQRAAFLMRDRQLAKSKEAERERRRSQQGPPSGGVAASTLAAASATTAKATRSILPHGARAGNGRLSSKSSAGAAGFRGAGERPSGPKKKKKPFALDSILSAMKTK